MMSSSTAYGVFYAHFRSVYWVCGCMRVWNTCVGCAVSGGQWRRLSLALSLAFSGNSIGCVLCALLYLDIIRMLTHLSCLARMLAGAHRDGVQPAGA